MDEAQSCPYDNAYKKCKCNPCEGFAYTQAEANAQGYVSDGSCQSCAVTKYKRKENPCTGYSNCDCGGEIGANVCYSGNVKKYKTCKSCCANECSLNYCPSGYICSWEKCSNRYCKARPDCQIGWIFYQDGTCDAPETYTGKKIALGVVIKDEWIMAASPVGSYQQAENYVNRRDLKENDFLDAISDYDGCENTDKILSNSQTSYPAAQAARSYAPTPETKGKWCLPASGTITSMYFHRDKYNVAITKLGGVPLDISTECVWSSSLCSYAEGSYWHSDDIFLGIS